MNYLGKEEVGMLLEEARVAAGNSYSPYSHFPVGAAVLTADGSVIRGTNVENASYSVTICAERIALGYAIAQGHTQIRAIAVHTPVRSAAPCGACRQFIMEFGKDIIIIFRENGEVMQRTIGELLPFGFTKTSMEAV